MQIKLSTNLGSIALAIAANAGEAAGNIGKLAMQQVVYHLAPARAFKKGAGFARDDKWSTALEAQVVASVESCLSEAGFEAIEVSGSEYVKADPAEALIKSMEKAGIKDARAILSAAKQPEGAGVKVEAKTEKVG
jgi:hypothetical protein